MTPKEWNEALTYLQNAIDGDWVSVNHKTVICRDMCGGNYTMYEDNEFYGLTDDVVVALIFLNQKQGNPYFFYTEK